MADAFQLVGAGWGVEFTDVGCVEIQENLEQVNQKLIQEYVKDTDIRKFGLKSILPVGLDKLSSDTLPVGRFLVQVQKLADVTQPLKFQEEFGDKKSRLLLLELSDGSQKLRAIEYGHITVLSADEVPPGSKLLLVSTEREPLHVQNGHILLTKDSVQVLGGYVERLVESWNATNEVEATRLLWKTEGIKKAAKGEGAPPWVDFDPRKCHTAAEKRAAENERAEWRKNQSTINVKRTEEEGPRFQLEDFAQDGDAPKTVKTQVAASAFKMQEKGKGKKGKDRESGGRRQDDDEEKRAPQAAPSLAAFIKPTKDGRLPDEALVIHSSSQAQESAGWNGGRWSEWDAGATEGWQASNWQERGSSWKGGSSNSGKGRGKGKGGKGGRGKRNGGANGGEWSW